MNIQKFVRKPFYVDAVQVTKDNLEQVAQWCGGTVAKDENSGQPYIQVDVFNPTDVPDHSRAYVGRWILQAATGYKVYKTKGFFRSFDQVTELSKPQADAAGIKVPHEPSKKPKPAEKRNRPVPQPPRNPVLTEEQAQRLESLKAEKGDEVDQEIERTLAEMEKGL